METTKVKIISLFLCEATHIIQSWECYVPGTTIAGFNCVIFLITGKMLHL